MIITNTLHNVGPQRKEQFQQRGSTHRCERRVRKLLWHESLEAFLAGFESLNGDALLLELLLGDHQDERIVVYDEHAGRHS